MELLPKYNEEFSKEEYWNTFFTRRGKKTFEWYGEYPELCEHLSKYVKTKDDILIVGCGNSKLSMDLYDVGYKNITNIDISKVVIDQMKDRNKIDRPNLVFERMDALNMTYNDNKFSVVIDKGTLDALMPDGSEEISCKVDKYFNELSRVLRKGGRYICISLLQEHILEKLLSFFPASSFMFRVTKCHDVENKILQEEGSNLFPVFFVMATKFSELTQQILELSLASGQITKVSSISELKKAILGVQQSAFICDKLRCTNIANDGEIMLELYLPNNDNPRYIIYVLDRPRTEGKTYVVFLVPQGREGDWLFNTTEGRKQFAEVIDKDRIAITVLGRNHNFTDWEEVKNELNTAVKNFTPPRLPPNSLIAYLSLGPDVGNREILYEYESQINGRIVVENVFTADCDYKYRRLIFLNNQFGIQSDAQLKSIKTRRGKKKEIVNHGYLACEYHIFMSIAVDVIISDHKRHDKSQFKEILIIGLGGGGLCMFLHRCFAQLKIIAVEIDEVILKIACEWFDFTTNERLKVKIDDGIKYIESMAKAEKKLDAIILDVNNNDTSVGMSFPSQQFLESKFLHTVSKTLNENGVLILNLVCRDKNIRPGVLTALKKVFSSIATVKLKNCVNEILICSIVKRNPEKWTRQFIESFDNFMNRITANKLSLKDNIEKTEFIECFKVET